MREAATVGAAIASLLVLVACAARHKRTGSRTARRADCFNVQFLTRYVTVDRDALKLRAGLGASHEVDISGAQCSQTDWTHRAAIESTPSS